MELKFTATRIFKLETENRIKLIDMFLFSVTNTVLFVQYGLDVDRNTALAKIEEYLQTNPINQLWSEIMEVLQRDNFLPKEVNLAEEAKKLQDSLTT